MANAWHTAINSANPFENSILTSKSDTNLKQQ